MFMRFGGFYVLKEISEDHDYTEYLGPNYTNPEKASTMISNHQSALDPVIGIGKYEGKFIAKAEVAKFPLYGTIATFFDTIYVD